MDKFMEEISNPQNNKINNLFLLALRNSEKNQELFVLLKQIDVTTGETIFDLIKKNLLKHIDHYGSDPKNWNDEGFHYGHIGILLNNQNKKLASQRFFIPDLNIKIETGRIIELPGGAGMRIVWKKTIDNQ